jgi:hypothetical protein
VKGLLVVSDSRSHRLLFLEGIRLDLKSFSMSVCGEYKWSKQREYMNGLLAARLSRPLDGHQHILKCIAIF